MLKRTFSLLPSPEKGLDISKCIFDALVRIYPLFATFVVLIYNSGMYLNIPIENFQTDQEY